MLEPGGGDSSSSEELKIEQIQKIILMCLIFRENAKVSKYVEGSLSAPVVVLS